MRVFTLKTSEDWGEMTEVNGVYETLEHARKVFKLQRASDPRRCYGLIEEWEIGNRHRIDAHEVE